MLQHLVESHPTERRWSRVMPAAATSAIAHALVIAWALLLYSGSEAATAEAPREVPRAQFVGIAPIEERTPDKPPPPPVHALPLNPTAGPGGGGRVAAPKYLPKTGATPIVGEKPLGFQELATPDQTKGIPTVDSLSKVAVRAEDFTGRGVIGGVAGGKPPDGPVAQKASEVIRADSVGFGPGTGGTGRGGTGGGTGGGEPWYYADDLEEPPRLQNAEELARMLPRLYPSALRSAGMGGRVEIEFVVDTMGRVRTETIQIISSAHELLSEATTKAMPQLRYVPGRIRYRGHTAKVQVRVRTAIDWALIEPRT